MPPASPLSRENVCFARGSQLAQKIEISRIENRRNISSQISREFNDDFSICLDCLIVLSELCPSPFFPSSETFGKESYGLRGIIRVYKYNPPEFGLSVNTMA